MSQIVNNSTGFNILLLPQCQINKLFIVAGETIPKSGEIFR